MVKIRLLHPGAGKIFAMYDFMLASYALLEAYALAYDWLDVEAQSQDMLRYLANDRIALCDAIDGMGSDVNVPYTKDCECWGNNMPCHHCIANQAMSGYFLDIIAYLLGTMVFCPGIGERWSFANHVGVIILDVDTVELTFT